MDLYLQDPRTTLLIHFIYMNISIEYKKPDRKQFYASWQELATTYLVDKNTSKCTDFGHSWSHPLHTHIKWDLILISHHQVSLVPTLQLEKVHWCTFRIIKRITWFFYEIDFYLQRIANFENIIIVCHKTHVFFKVLHQRVPELGNITKIILRSANSWAPACMKGNQRWLKRQNKAQRWTYNLYEYRSISIQLNISQLFQMASEIGVSWL